MESEETKILGQLNREPSTTNEEFTLSSDGKWGVKEILTTIMVQNMENKKKKIIYTKEGQSGDVQWISKNRLLIEDYVKDLKKNFVIIYDCKSDSQREVNLCAMKKFRNICSRLNNGFRFSRKQIPNLKNVSTIAQ
ncbi:MAG: hypothetical protein Q4D65_08640 [Peptostreptococcaceae bacterium]|nr:hypothetical protein [Peptostreptococcaceae bacterium]